MINYTILSPSSSNSYRSLKQRIQIDNDIINTKSWTFSYPITLYSSSDPYEKHTFCDNKIEVSRVSHLQMNRQWKYFVITQKDGTRLYCTMFTFYQKMQLLYEPLPLNSSLKQFYVPKCLVIYSQKQYYKLMTNLVKIYRDLRNMKQWLPTIVSSEILVEYEQYLNNNCQYQWENSNFSIPPNQNLSSFNIKQVFQYYIQITNQLEQKQKVYLSPTNNNLEILHDYHISDSLYTINYFMHLPMNSHVLAQTLTAILLQKQIIFVSTDLNLTVITMETLLKMIAPLKWDFMYVPNLPEQLLDAANYSFQPYLVGIQLKLLCRLQLNNKIVINLDQNRIMTLQQLNIPFQIVQSCQNLQTSQRTSTYLQWERQIRINSLMMITSIISCVRNNKLNKKKSAINMNLKASIQKIKTSLSSVRNMHSRVVSEDYYLRLFNEKFYDEFVNNSTMICRYFQAEKEPSMNTVVAESKQLLGMLKNSRLEYLYVKFQSVELQAQYPILYNNDKQIKQNSRIKTQPNTFEIRSSSKTKLTMINNNNNLHQTANYTLFKQSQNKNDNRKIKISDFLANRATIPLLLSRKTQNKDDQLISQINIQTTTNSKVSSAEKDFPTKYGFSKNKDSRYLAIKLGALQNRNCTTAKNQRYNLVMNDIHNKLKKQNNGTTKTINSKTPRNLVFQQGKIDAKNSNEGEEIYIKNSNLSCFPQSCQIK